MSNLFLKPCTIDGAPAVVRDPHTLAPLAVGGENKADNDYWRRRLRDGDVEEASPVTATPTPDPSPQGGGERTELAVDDLSATRKNARSRS